MVTIEGLTKFKDEYKDSEEERGHLLEAFEKYKGKLNKVYESVMLSNPLEDEDRFRTIIDKSIEDGEVEGFEAYTQESEKSKKRRMDKARREAKEAEEMEQETADKEMSGKKGKGGKAKDDLGDLMAMIQQKQRGRGAAFLENLEAKYAGGGSSKRGKKRATPMDEPPEEAFQRNAAPKTSSKKQKSNEAPEGEGNRLKGTRKSTRGK